ncbi:endonuclease/exonuclease/phosphatase family protein [Streptomonospora nanhaiensis]|uniref:endonuclease/exonuclease/phosphatase family protein n=1 Tax=Streptomonospora nanhaiensis TaxID=1323731 RepID=UPI001C383094|nr:endonuclease/exonuclease/phosphatase family protein [Streptomonospora nanhaiensis]MBV2362408.1 endonuclease/exonuclease/phosphatase family protein [Streptomonospora nanhaiensis]MBX9389125.1 endonuclease/exonuclease/phosphatase family protein [Streptomonospora nanhaiensis]
MSNSDLRVLSYNVRALRDDPDAVARVISACDPDIVCLQEAPRLLGWRAKRRELDRATGMVPAISRRTGGLAILCRPGVEVRRIGHRVLRQYPAMHTRTLSMAALKVDGSPLLVGCTHLDLHPGARLHHAGEALDHLGAFAAENPGPYVLAADVNCPPEGSAWRLITAVMHDAAGEHPWGEADTFPARRPRTRIDGVFTSGDVRVRRAGVPVDLVDPADLAAASDHRPVLADITL